MKNTEISYPVGTKVILPNGVATITETRREPHPIPKRDISFYKVKYDDIEKNNEYEKDMLYTNKDFFIMTPERKALIDYAESKEWDWQEVNEHFLIHEQANSKNNDTQMTIIIWHENLSFQATSYKEDEHETTSYEVPLDLGELIINYMRSLKEEAKNDIREVGNDAPTMKDLTDALVLAETGSLCAQHEKKPNCSLLISRPLKSVFCSKK